VQTNAVVPLSSRKKFILARLHSLAGLIPLGLFFIQHLLGNALAILGKQAYDEHIEFMVNLPFLLLLEIGFIAIPLLFHAVYGIYLSFISKPNSHVYNYGRNISFLLQRITGVVTFIFVIYHVWALRISPAISGIEVTHQLVGEHLSNPFMLVFYMAGVASTSYHFANGISTALITWGVTLGPSSQKAVKNLCFALFIGLTALGAGSLISFVL
jgi:succinate dehydrogenase / fumarate reductase, cytochrome b subunit